MYGLFSESELMNQQKPTQSMVPKCGLCGLFKGCITPRMKPHGRGKKRILLVGEAPGEDEDKKGIQFIGKAGRKLREVCRRIGFDVDRDAVKTNALICRPPNNDISNFDMVDWCRPNLIKTINEVKPDIIIPMGKVAFKSLLSWVWKDDIGTTVERWVGWRIPCQKLNAWICPTYHPSYILREESSVLELWFERHLKAATELKGKPWDVVPNYLSQVQVIVNPKEAAKQIRRITQAGGEVSFDYETNCLKPDNKYARIVACSLCWEGQKTIAYPWHGPAIDATFEFLRSKRCKKIGYNLKFEERWTRRMFGVGVRNWIWCGMTAAHILDNRPGISGLKFQAFVQLGQDVWDANIQQFLHASGGYGENKIKQVGLSDLLLYCGMDSLMEFIIAKKQMKEVEDACVRR